MGNAGTAAAKFSRAMEQDNVMAAVTLAVEMPQPLALIYALDLTTMFARVADPRFDSAAARLLARLVEERKLSLPFARIVSDTLELLPDPVAYRILKAIVNR